MSTSQWQMFTERELQVIQLLLQGKSNKLIALHLGVSTRAIEIHLTHIYEKLGVYSRTEADLFSISEPYGDSSTQAVAVAATNTCHTETWEVVLSVVEVRCIT